MSGNFRCSHVSYPTPVLPSWGSIRKVYNAFLALGLGRDIAQVKIAGENACCVLGLFLLKPPTMQYKKGPVSLYDKQINAP